MRQWLGRSIRSALVLAGFEGKARSVSLLIQWALSVLILYRVDWRRVPLIGTDDPQASSEVRLALAALGSVLVVFSLNFLWQIIRQPALMDAELRQEMAGKTQAAAERDDQLQAEIRRLQGALDGICDAEELLKRLSRLYEEGRAIYLREADRETWEDRLRAWDTEVETIIEENFSISTLHRYRRSSGGGMWQTTWTAPDKDERLKYRYTGRLIGLDDLIKLGSPLRLAELNIPR